MSVSTKWVHCNGIVHMSGLICSLVSVRMAAHTDTIDAALDFTPHRPGQPPFGNVRP
jgi:hypothetical protein